MSIKRLTKEYTRYKEKNFNFPNMIIHPSSLTEPEGLLTWYFLFYDLCDTEYSFIDDKGIKKGGLYLGKIKIPHDYPFSPPDFYFLTDTGIFIINSKICTSFTSFHAEEYSASYTIETLCTSMLSFFTDYPKIITTGMLNVRLSQTEKQNIAKLSYTTVQQHPIFIKLLSPYFFPKN